MYMSQHTYNIHDVLHIPYKKTHPPAGSVVIAPLCLPAERHAYYVIWIHITQYASSYNITYCIISYYVISYIILHVTYNHTTQYRLLYYTRPQAGSVYLVPLYYT